MISLQELKYMIIKYEHIHFYFYWLYFVVDILFNGIIILLLPILNFFFLNQGNWVLIVVGILTGFQNIFIKTVQRKIQHETSYKSYRELRDEIFKSDDPQSEFRQYHIQFNMIRNVSPTIPFFTRVPRVSNYTEEEMYQINRQFEG